jgi:hypothetical protein
VSRFIEALKRKYRTLHDALRALGLDPALVDHAVLDDNISDFLKEGYGNSPWHPTQR